MNRTPTINENRSATTFGYIYKHTSPSGKSYIGQTIYTPDQRWVQHVTAARRRENRCRALENAIISHGAESFTHETLLKVNEDMLDFYEALFIELHGTIAPNGYNLREGGDGGCSDEMRAQMRIGNDKKTINKSWPPDPDDMFPKTKYIFWYHETNSHGTHLEGFRVSDHPNGRRKVFSDSSLSMLTKYNQAKEYKIFLDDYEGFYDEREEFPMHLSKWTDDGFKVRKPGYPSRYYRQESKELNYSKAFGYLVSICGNHEFDRVFKCCYIVYFD